MMAVIPGKNLKHSLTGSLWIENRTMVIYQDKLWIAYVHSENIK